MYHNTDLCVDIKTILHNDPIARTGKFYNGELVNDVDGHYIFFEADPRAPRNRYPRLFNGKYITVTRHADGSLHPYLKPVGITYGISINSYVRNVSMEMRKALSCLVEK